MGLTLTTADLPRLAAGASFCGSGGGGSTRFTEILVRGAFESPVQALLPTEVSPDTMCFAPAFAGSTLLLSERLPGFELFSPLVRIAERWLGARLEAACSFEAGGMNALTPFLFSAEHTIIDADCSGRAVPTVDRTSLYIDKVPGVFAVCSTGAGGFSLIQSERAEDVDQLMRAAMIQAGGTGTVLFSGFTAGDLISHALHGHLVRSLHIGKALAETASEPLEQFVTRIGATLIGQGRILELTQSSNDPHVHAAEIEAQNGEVLRLIARSEFLAVVVDGVAVSAAPDYIAAIDVRSREIVEATDLRPNRHIAVVTLPADSWWRSSPDRSARLVPSTYGIPGLDPT
ncbi:DUF917 family protein [Leucobacter viscericola]|uniref:DUF917 family protein n=1 Tax=Leucobacter viscericola TaxID=2714935 RepID=A0A6G7XCH4_9MICO|nr:DUF917 family protein [Leucobacter viscericola]QIK62068.1 DUF917 family protein [Leucobacter viscericola]